MPQGAFIGFESMVEDGPSRPWGGCRRDRTHDFNNLLTAIGARSELLLSRLRADDPVHRDVDLIQRTASRAVALTGLDPMLRRVLGEDVVTDVVMPEMSGREVADTGPIETTDPALNIGSSNSITGRLLDWLFPRCGPHIRYF